MPTQRAPWPFTRPTVSHFWAEGEALALLADAVLDGHPHVVEGDLPGRSPIIVGHWRTS